jgi:transcriptional regulator with XRE-family HTH domain
MHILTQTETAARLNITLPTLRKWEQDGRVPPALRNAAGRRIGWLLEDVRDLRAGQPAATPAAEGNLQ